MNLNSKIKFLLSVFAAFGASVLFTGCSDDSEIEDAAENAGDAIENAGDKVTDAAEEAGDEIKDATN